MTSPNRNSFANTSQSTDGVKRDKKAAVRDLLNFIKVDRKRDAIEQLETLNAIGPHKNAFNKSFTNASTISKLQQYRKRKEEARAEKRVKNRKRIQSFASQVEGSLYPQTIPQNPLPLRMANAHRGIGNKYYRPGQKTYTPIDQAQYPSYMTPLAESYRRDALLQMGVAVPPNLYYSSAVPMQSQFQLPFQQASVSGTGQPVIVPMFIPSVPQATGPHIPPGQMVVQKSK